ncbi:hypothetical protein, conserved [Leishmania shawi]|uniref:Leucine-rich repeat protein n=1 Tax=Leishmania shawi TaxID=5680 RepID=A0ABR3E4E9_9TRYP
MSSTGISSTNGVTSTAVSDTSGSFAAPLDGASSTTNMLTTDAIIRECIKQGFYRNPICNEKLYLHNRGYDSIASTAFEPYTDVKVLWLEGNGFSVLPCGKGYTQVRPPVRVDPFAAELEVAEAERAAAAAVLSKCSGQHVDPNTEAISHPDSPSQNGIAQKEPSLPLATDVPPNDRDVFSSLYPTVRQLYLHNNLFRFMPDLSRFERLDAVNLSGNFFTTVEPHCVYYDAAVRGRHASEVVDGVAPTSTIVSGARHSPSQSVQCEQEQSCQQLPHGPHSTNETAPSAELAVVTSSDDAKRQRAGQMARCRHVADVFSVFCKHSPLPESEEAKEVRGEGHQGRVSSPLLKQPLPLAPEYRNPCSSLRSLNLAGNRIESFEECLGLLCYHSLAVLDLSHNHIADGEALLLILERLPRLQSLKLSGNPLVRSLPRYRKCVLSRCKRLLHLDDRPVFAEERRLVTAWAIGGEDGEEKERAAIQQEKSAAEKKRLADFRRLISRHQRTDPTKGPHADYIHAITTVAALSAAADTAGSHGQNSATRSSRAPRHRDGRPSTSDPDSSSTSSESEGDSDDDNHVGRGAGEQSAAARTTVIAYDSNTAAQAGMIVTQQENNPPRETPYSSSSQQQRGLNSNQRVKAAVSIAAVGGATGSGEDDDESGDIFVPNAV